MEPGGPQPGIGGEAITAPAPQGVYRFILYGGLGLALSVFLLPLVWMALTGLKPLEQTLKSPPEWLPRTWTATLTRRFAIDSHGNARKLDAPLLERIPVVKLRKLEEPEALVVGGKGEDERAGQGRFEGQRMLVQAADLRPVAGAWGQTPSPGAAAMRLRLGAEKEKRHFGCEFVERYEPGRWLVRESLPDPRQATKPAGSGAEVTYAWGVVEESDLREEVRCLWENVPVSLNKMDFWRMLQNTLWVCVLGMLGTTLASALVAYGLAFGRFPGRGLLFAATLATMMVPFPATMVPMYQLYRELGWIGSFKPLWVHCWFGAAFNIFLLRQFFLGLPKELFDAARIDGCGELEIFWYVVVPLSRPALAMVALFHFLYAWKDFMGPLLYLTDKSQFTLSLGLQAFQSQQGGTPWHLVMAASTVFSLPLILLFLLTLKTFVRGIAMTGIKG